MNSRRSILCIVLALVVAVSPQICCCTVWAASGSADGSAGCECVAACHGGTDDRGDDRPRPEHDCACRETDRLLAIERGGGSAVDAGGSGSFVLTTVPAFVHCGEAPSPAKGNKAPPWIARDRSLLRQHCALRV